MAVLRGASETLVTRTVEVWIPDDLLQLIDERARKSGLTREDYIRAVLAREGTRTAPINEILAPLREQVKATGTTDDDLALLFYRAQGSIASLKR
jgi:Ribbon-helix-helix protein, copG family